MPPNAAAAPDAVAIALRRVMEERPDGADRLLDGRRAEPPGARLHHRRRRQQFARAALHGATPPPSTSSTPSTGPWPSTPPTRAALARSKRLELLRIAARDLLGHGPARGRGTGPGRHGRRRPRRGVVPGHRRHRRGRVRRHRHGQARRPRAQLRQRRRRDVRDGGARRRRRGPATCCASPGRASGSTSTCAPKAGRDRSPAPSTATAPTGTSGRRPGSSRPCSKPDRWPATPSSAQSFAAAAGRATWSRTFSADELAELRSMKARAEAEASRRGLAGREIKRSPGASATWSSRCSCSSWSTVITTRPSGTAPPSAPWPS